MTQLIGVTNNLEKRLRAHNSGKGAKYTRSRLPVAYRAVITGLEKSEAFRIEYQIKQKPRAQKIAALVAYKRKAPQP